MKTFLKKYENYFSTDKPDSNVRLNLDAISVGEIELNEYITLCKEFFKESYSGLFDIAVRYAWLRRQFHYYSEKANPQMKRNSIRLSLALSKLMRRNVGSEPQVITHSAFFRTLEPYFDSLFPGFEEGNPFENPDYYKFPFKNISIDFLILVRQMDDRMELLQLAEEEKMSYAVFADYVINHVLSINEDLSEPKYEISNYAMNGTDLFYVKDKTK